MASRAETSPARLRPGPLARAATWLSDEALLVVVFATVASFWSFDLAGGVRADTWLTLLGGREILQHGLPHHDALAVVSHGRAWIDQQWLSQLFFYELFRAGGIGLVLRANVVLFLVPLWLSLVAARRRGASTSRILLVALPAFLLTETFVRAQVLSQVLFVGLLLLLVAESRRPSWRIALALPVLVVWANLHGAVVVGAALTALLGAVELVRGRRAAGRRALLRPLALLVLPWLCVLATPYGLAVTTYYRSTIANPLLARYLTEWRSPQFWSAWGVPFFLLAFLALFLVARRPRRLNAFELLALALTLCGGLLAVRSIVWFVYVATILLPRLLEDVWPVRAANGLTARDRVFRAVAAVGAVALCLAVFARPAATVEEQWPAGAVSAVSMALQQDPDAKVLANGEYADWLLYRLPSARGRIAFDGRWEILSPAQFKAAMRFLHQQGPSWDRIGRGYGILVLDPEEDDGLVRELAARPGVRVAYLDRRVAVLRRSPRAAASAMPQPSRVAIEIPTPSGSPGTR